jgi:hypothetical protein
MKYLKTQFLLSVLLLLIIASCSPYKSIEVSKTASNVGGPKTLIYSLPKTRVDINVQVTKTTTIAGPYAAYAEKYLSLTGVALSKVEAFEISNIHISPVNEPDPEHFYAVSFKNYPSNLDKLFSMTQQGLMLNLEDSWKSVSNDFPSKQSGSGVLFETSIREPNIKERVDTFYKTILTDASFVKVPIYKKSVEIKTEEQKAEDMANLILKIRKRRLKLMMGEYEFHPEGAALKVIVEELGKQEEELMSNFIGKKIKETFSYSYSFSPAGPFSKELLWFSEDKGVSESSKNGLNAVSVSFNMKETPAPETGVKLPEKLTNSIYFRSPEMTSVSVKLGNKVLAEAKIPVFQAGKIQQLPVQ